MALCSAAPKSEAPLFQGHSEPELEVLICHRALHKCPHEVSHTCCLLSLHVGYNRISFDLWPGQLFSTKLGFLESSVSDSPVFRPAWKDGNHLLQTWRPFWDRDGSWNRPASASSYTLQEACMRCKMSEFFHTNVGGRTSQDVKWAYYWESWHFIAGDCVD